MASRWSKKAKWHQKHQAFNHSLFGPALMRGFFIKIKDLRLEIKEWGFRTEELAGSL